MFITDLFDKISNERSKNEKIKLLNEYENKEELKTILYYTYNGRINFFITSKNIQLDNNINNNMNFPVEILPQILKTNGSNAKKKLIEEGLIPYVPKVREYFLRVLDRDLKIGINIKTINKVFPDLIPEFKLMKAERESKQDFLKAFADCNFLYWNLKLDGIRAIGDFRNFDEIVFMSRDGLCIDEFLIENIKRDIIENRDFFEGKQFDGEIYNGNFQSLMTIFRRKNIDFNSIQTRDKVKFWIFDVIMPDKKLSERLQILQRMPEMKFVKLLPYYKVDVNYELVCKIRDRAILNKHEGIMVKHPESLYEFKRSFSWMKFKAKNTEEFEVVGYQEGSGKYCGMLGSLEIKIGDRTVDVGSGFTDEERKRLWNMRNELIGKKIEIEYMEETKDGSLRHPVFSRIHCDR